MVAPLSTKHLRLRLTGAHSGKMETPQLTCCPHRRRTRATLPVFLIRTAGGNLFAAHRAGAGDCRRDDDAKHRPD
jgi:hypothetical protein